MCKRRKMVWVLVTLGLSFIAGVAFGQPKGDLVVCQGAEVSSLDLLMLKSTIDFNYANQVLDMLYFPDNEGIPRPRLAVSHKLINDTTWEFKLRRGVKFHNGSVMTAKDVKVSIDRRVDPNINKLNSHLFSTIREVKVVNDYTIQIITKAPDPLLLQRIAFQLWIVPADLFSEKGPEAFSQHPVGTGPFKFVSWSRNERMILEANEEYWDGAPKVKRVIFRPVPEAATRLAELQTGNADIITNVPPFLVSQMKDSANATVLSILSGRMFSIVINCLVEGPLKNKKVRQALNYAVDRKAIIDNILKGSAIPRAVNLTPYHFGYDPSLKPYPYDPGKAKKLLAEAGYPNGLKLVLNTPSGRYMMDKEVCEAIAGMFHEVGIETDLKILEWGTYLQMLFGRKIQDLALNGWMLQYHDADGSFYAWFHPEPPSSHYSTPELKRKIEEARITLDNKKRSQLYKDVQKEIYEEAPFIFLYQGIEHYGVSRKIKGFEPGGDEQFILHKVSK